MSNFTIKLKKEIHKKSGTVCPLCKSKGYRDPKGWIRQKEQAIHAGERTNPKFEVDHILPKSKGGKALLINARLICRRCNRAKCNRDYTHLKSRQGGKWIKIKVE